MRKSLGLWTVALLVAIALVALATPVVATPDMSSTHALSFRYPEPIRDLLAWMNRWLDSEAPQNAAATASGTNDPAGKPTEPAGPDPGDGAAVTEEGGHTMDPDG